MVCGDVNDNISIKKNAVKLAIRPVHDGQKRCATESQDGRDAEHLPYCGVINEKKERSPLN